MFACLQGVPAGAYPGYVTVGATPKAGENTSKPVHDLTEIALAHLPWGRGLDGLPPAGTGLDVRIVTLSRAAVIPISGASRRRRARGARLDDHRWRVIRHHNDRQAGIWIDWCGIVGPQSTQNPPPTKPSAVPSVVPVPGAPAVPVMAVTVPDAPVTMPTVIAMPAAAVVPTAIGRGRSSGSGDQD